MNVDYQYVLDKNGTPRSVLVSIKEWNAIISKLENISFLNKFEKDIKNGMKYIEDVKKGKKKAKLLTDFLNEL